MFRLALLLSALAASSAYSIYQPINCQNALDLVSPVNCPPPPCNPCAPQSPVCSPQPAPCPPQVVCVPTGSLPPPPPTSGGSSSLLRLLLLLGGNNNPDLLQSLIKISLLGGNGGLPGSLLDLGILNNPAGGAAPGLGGLLGLLGGGGAPAPAPNPLQSLIDIGVLGQTPTSGSLLNLGLLTSPPAAPTPTPIPAGLGDLIGIILGGGLNGTNSTTPFPPGTSSSLISLIIQGLLNLGIGNTGTTPPPANNQVLQILILSRLLSALQVPPTVPCGPCPPGSVPVTLPSPSLPPCPSPIPNCGPSYYC